MRIESTRPCGVPFHPTDASQPPHAACHSPPASRVFSSLVWPLCSRGNASLLSPAPPTPILPTSTSAESTGPQRHAVLHAWHAAHTHRDLRTRGCVSRCMCACVVRVMTCNCLSSCGRCVLGCDCQEQALQPRVMQDLNRHAYKVHKRTGHGQVMCRAG
jgi:hypothetical protein